MTNGSGPTTGSMSDDTLLERARAGDDDALAVLYERHHLAARAAAWSLVRSRDEIDDVVAEAFTGVIAALRRGGGPDTAFRPYLLVCVRHAAYSRRDAGADPNERLAAAAADDRAADPVGEKAVAGEDRSLARQAYESLPDRWRQVLWYTVVEGRSLASTANELGLAPNATAALAMRAREGLREAYLQRHVGSARDPACRENRDRVGAYVRGNLGRRDRRHVTEHLRGCSTCSELADELGDVNRALRASFGPIVALPVAGVLVRWGSRVGLTSARLAELRLRLSVPTLAASAVVVAAVGGAAVDRPITPELTATTTSSQAPVAPPATSGTAASPVAAPAPVVTLATSSTSVSTEPTTAPPTTTATTPVATTGATPPTPSATAPRDTAPPPASAPPLTVPPVTLPPETVASETIPPATLPPETLPPVSFPPITLPGGGPPPITLPDVAHGPDGGLGNVGHAAEASGRFAQAAGDRPSHADAIVEQILEQAGLGGLTHPISTLRRGLGSD